MNLLTLLQNLLLFLMLMVPGFIMGKYKLLSEKAQAEQKGAKRRMPWDKKETDAAKHDDADAKDASKKDARKA